MAAILDDSYKQQADFFPALFLAVLGGNSHLRGGFSRSGGHLRDCFNRSGSHLRGCFCAEWWVAAILGGGMMSTKGKVAGKGKQPANKPAIPVAPEPSDDEFDDPVNFAIIQCLEALVRKRRGPALQALSSAGGKQMSFF